MASVHEEPPHPGGNPEFWQDEVVKNYDHQQTIVAEGKGEALTSLVRVVNYFLQHQSISAPIILDIGCGPGTLSTRILDEIKGRYADVVRQHWVRSTLVAIK